MHDAAGIWGAIACGIFRKPSEAWAVCLAAQLLGVAVCFAYTGTCAFVLYKLIRT